MCDAPPVSPERGASLRCVCQFATYLRHRLLDTMRLFRDAESVVGYHGAGFVNTAFSRYACVHELSTLDAEATLFA